MINGFEFYWIIMIQSIQEFQQYYQGILDSIESNQVQQISHKGIKQNIQKLNSLAFNKKMLRESQRQIVADLLAKLTFIDSKFQYAINNCVLKNQFEQDLRKHLLTNNPQQQTQNNTQKLIQNHNHKYTQKTNSTIKNPKHLIVSNLQTSVPHNASVKIHKNPQNSLNVSHQKHKRQPTHRQEEVAKKQKLIQELLKENMKLRERSNASQTQSNIMQRNQINRIEEYIYTNKLLVAENRQIQQKLQKLETVLEALLQQNAKQEKRVVEPDKITFKKPQSQQNSGKKDSKEFPALEQRYSRSSSPFSDTQFYQYYSERDKLERNRNKVYAFTCISNDLKGITPKSPSFTSNHELISHNQLTLVPLTLNQNLDMSLKHQRSQARMQDLTSMSQLPRFESEVLQPDLRQYILPKEKKASNVSLLDENSDEQDNLNLGQSSLRGSIELKKRSAIQFDNDNLSFSTFQTISSVESSNYDDNLIIESRQNTRILNTPRMESISKSTLVRNKVAFFKKSLVLIKDDLTVEIAFKKSQLNREMDCIRVSFYITNKLESQEPIDISYQYDRNSYELIVNQKAEVMTPSSVTQEDITIYYKGKIPPSFIVGKVQLEEIEYQFVLPIFFFTFKEGLHRLDPNEVKTITIFPQKQFSSPRFMHSILPLTYVNEHEEIQYRRGQKSYIAECTLVSKKTIQGLRLQWTHNLIKLTCDKGFVDMLAWILADIQP